jgi:hypothetical protein
MKNTCGILAFWTMYLDSHNVTVILPVQTSAIMKFLIDQKLVISSLFFSGTIIMALSYNIRSKYGIEWLT